jgi:hypothetical protein
MFNFIIVVPGSRLVKYLALAVRFKDKRLLSQPSAICQTGVSYPPNQSRWKNPRNAFFQPEVEVLLVRVTPAFIISSFSLSLNSKIKAKSQYIFFDLDWSFCRSVKWLSGFISDREHGKLSNYVMCVQSNVIN